MKRAFVVRPFKPRGGVDFTRVHRDLIAPALQQAGLRGDTTLELVEAGNIRVDMFRLLVTADVVVADVSIHNANVFYELGIRHGLRPRATVMIRSRVEGNDWPFDLQTDRYLEYDAAKPEAILKDLVRALQEAATGSKRDSPVYLLLPDLQAPDPAALKVVPRDFHEEVRIASANGRRGDLRLLAWEARGFEWESEGLRVVGREQFSLGANGGARDSFEWLRESQPEDIEANQRLATLYQRLGDLPASNLAIQRVIDNPASTSRDLAEAFALHARNLKSDWRKEFADASVSVPQARGIALRSPRIEAAQQAYAAAFKQDLNGYFPGINAMSLLALRIELAQTQPALWSDLFETQEEAAARLQSAQQELGDLTGAVRCCLQASRERLEREREPAQEELMWLSLTEADFAFLTASKPSFVARRYREALTGASSFGAGAALAQLEIFERLSVRPALTAAALEVVRQFAAPQSPGATQQSRHVLLFTGHRLDEPGRPAPRFPNTERAQAQARLLIRKAIEGEAGASAGLVGIAGGASGGDILFHEICAEMGIRTELFLALPPDQFCVQSVADGGPEWIERYWRLVNRPAPAPAARVLAQEKELPHWLQNKQDYGFWQRSNLWMLFNALAGSLGGGLTLIALWNGQEGDGPGGTRDLITQTANRGQKTVVLDANPLQDLT